MSSEELVSEAEELWLLACHRLNQPGESGHCQLKWSVHNDVQNIFRLVQHLLVSDAASPGIKLRPLVIAGSPGDPSFLARCSILPASSEGHNNSLYFHEIVEHSKSANE